MKEIAINNSPGIPHSIVSYEMSRGPAWMNDDDDYYYSARSSLLRKPSVPRPDEPTG